MSIIVDNSMDSEALSWRTKRVRTLDKLSGLSSRVVPQHYEPCANDQQQQPAQQHSIAHSTLTTEQLVELPSKMFSAISNTATTSITSPQTPPSHVPVAVRRAAAAAAGTVGPAAPVLVPVARCSPSSDGWTSSSSRYRTTAFTALPLLLLFLGSLVLVADARTTSKETSSSSASTSSPTTTTIGRTSAAAPVSHSGFFANFQPDYPPELRPRIPDEPLHQYRIFQQKGNTEEELPVCSPYSVCNKISTYSTPYAERMCRCGDDDQQQCSTSLDAEDGHTVTDKNSQFKLCEPVKKLPQCKLFSDISYSMIFYPDNGTQMVMHCTCPKNAVTYIVHKDPYHTHRGGYGYFYSFACSPIEMVCKRKEPCRLFSARQRSHFQEVTTTVLCRCPSNRSCPSHHSDHGVVPGKVYSVDTVRTYSGYCV